MNYNFFLAIFKKKITKCARKVSSLGTQTIYIYVQSEYNIRSKLLLKGEVFMGRVFFILTTLSLMLALLTNRAPSAASALLNSAESGVSLMLTLLGTMTLWSGLMEVLLRTGDVAKLGLLIRKLFGRHSRALPDTDCWEAVGMNLAANVLGLGNAATPPGVSAAKQLAAHGEPGLRVLALLLVLNNSSLQVLPTTVLTLRQAAGAQHPADIWVAMLISSAAATAAGVILLGVYDKIRQKGANLHGESRRRHPHPDRSADASARKMRGR